MRFVGFLLTSARDVVESWLSSVDATHSSTNKALLLGQPADGLKVFSFSSYILLQYYLHCSRQSPFEDPPLALISIVYVYGSRRRRGA